MAAFIDYYRILELDKNASADDIRKAYRRLARKYHPDLNPGDEAAQRQFQQINEANEVLGDPEKREKYDRYGAEWKHAEQYEQMQREQGGRSSAGGQDTFTGTGGFSDFFEQFFGAGGTAGRSAGFRGGDYHADLELGLQEVYTTQKKVLTVNGKQVRITIPAGVADGQEIRLRGYGAPGMHGGPAGDLYIRFILNNPTPFNRIGDDLYTTVSLPLYTAILGGEVLLDTWGGTIRLKVPPETQNGTRIRVKGKGMPVYKKEGEWGDLYVTYELKIPTGLTEQERELFRKLANK